MSDATEPEAPQKTVEQLVAERGVLLARDLKKWLDDVSKISVGKATRTAVGDDHISYESLISSIDVVYGAVYGYAVYELATRLKPIVSVPMAQPSWTELGLLGFVAYFMVASSSECRVYNATFPYARRLRFVLDLLIAGTWLLALIAAAGSSSAVLAVLTVVVLLRMVWCVSLEYETRERWEWMNPRVLSAAHLGLALVLGVMYWTAYLRPAVSNMDLVGVGYLWLAYVCWVLFLMTFRRLKKIPAAEADLLPIGFVHGFLWKAATTTWNNSRRMLRSIANFLEQK
jgi:hypothetical protein